MSQPTRTATVDLHRPFVAPPAPPTNTRAAALAVALGVVAALSIGKLPPALPALGTEFGLTLAQSGTLVSVFNTLGMVASIFMGLVTPRVGALRMCVGGLALLAGGGVLGLAAPGLGALLAARFVEGVGFLAVVVAAPALLVRATAVADLKRVFGFWGAYMPTGTALAMVAAPLLMAAAGWRVLWAAVAACTALTLVLLWRRRADYAAPAAGAALPQWRQIAGPLRAAGPWCIALAFACYVFNYYAVMTWLPTFLVAERQLTLASAALLTALVVAANIPGNLLGGWLLQRGVSRGANVVAAGLCTLATVALIFAPALPDGLRYAGCVLFSLSVGVLPGSIMSASQSHASTPAQVGTVQGMIMQGSNLGQFISPLLVAAVVAGAGRAGAADAAGGAPDWSHMAALLAVSGVAIVALGLWLRAIEARLTVRA